MAIYCHEHNQLTAHAISHESGNESVLLQQMNKRTKGKKKTQQQNHNKTIYPLYLFFCICYEE